MGRGLAISLSAITVKEFQTFLLMDPDARQIKFNYTGGSLTLTVGNAKDLFGDDYQLLASTSVPVESSVAQHSRVRVIGGPSTTVSPHNRSYQQWPTSNSSNAAAGKVVLLAWEGSAGEWQCRASGSMSALATFLSETAPKPVVFRTSRGTSYGPFVATP